LARSTSALVPHPIPLAPPQQIGQLKAIGVDWLKQEFATWIAVKPRQGEEDTSGATVVVGGLDPMELLLTPEISDSEENKESTDVKRPLVDLLFPTDLPALSNGTQSSPAAIPTEETQDADALPEFLLSIPFYISTLNLLCIILPHIQPTPALKSRISSHLNSLSKSSGFLTEVLGHAQASGGNGLEDAGEDDDSAGVLEESRADIFALEDACARAKVAYDRAGVE